MVKKKKDKKHAVRKKRPIVSIDELPVPLESMEELEFVEAQADFDWNSLVELYKKDWVTEEFIRRHWVDGVGNKAISGRGNLSDEFIRDFQDMLHWEILLEKQRFDEITLERYYLHVKYLWDKVLRYQSVSESFVIRHASDIDREKGIEAAKANDAIPVDVKMNIICFLQSKTKEQSMSEAEAKAADDIIWESCGGRRVSESGDLELDFIERFKDRLNWHTMLESQQFDEDFFEKYYDDYIYLERFCLMQFQDVPESFVQRHIDDFDAVDVSAIDFNDVMSGERKKNIVGLFPKEMQDRIIRLFMRDETLALFEEQE